MRESNQDAAYARSWPHGALLAVADGMGGLPGGEIASTLAIRALEDTPDGGEPATQLRAAFEAASRAIRAAAERDATLVSMGTTLVAATVRDDEAWVAHLGDSRAYRWDGAVLVALTRDHNLAEEDVRAGRIDADEARMSPRRHALTRAVGRTPAEPDVAGPITLGAGSTLLLVSDGVCGVVPESRIAEAVAGRRGGGVAARLRELAHEEGAPDNVAVALLECRS